MSVTPSTRRWKLMCGILAAVTAYSWVHNPTPFSAARGSASSRMTAHGPVRLAAGALGVSPQALVAQLLETRDLVAMRAIAERLALVAGDESIEPLVPLLTDTREGVPELAIGIYGKIGTDRAVATLTELTKDNRYNIVSTAVSALGETRNPKAETFLIGYFERTQSSDALSALAAFATPGAVAVIAHAAEVGDEETQRVAFGALGAMHTPESQEALRALIDSPSVTTATHAMDALTDIDDDTLVKLTAIVDAGDSELGKSAIAAIGRAGDPAGPVLANIALEGSADLRIAAVRALGSVHTQLAFDTLSHLVETDEGAIAETALGSIAALDTPEARELLISVAMADGPLAGNAVSELSAMNGPEIDAALLVIAKSDSATASAALATLLGREHPEAMGLVVARAHTGDDDSRFKAFEMLAHAGTQAALDKLLELVRAEHGALKIRAFALFATDHRGDPAVGEMLRESLHAADSGEAVAAANALASAGTDDARAALIGVLTTSDDELLYATVRALDNYRLDDAAAAALANAAEHSPEVAPLVMRKLLAVGSTHGIRLAETAVHGDDPMVAVRAMELLREIGSKAALKIIEDAVHTTEGDVRAVAVRALGESRDPHMVDVITSALDDSNASVHQSVAFALRAIGGEQARGALLTMSRSADADDRVAALQVMRDETDRSSTQRIKEMVRDPDSRVQQYAIYAMAGNTVGVPELRRLILDPGMPYQTRVDAARALQRYSELDDRTSEWLAANGGTDDYSE